MTEIQSLLKLLRSPATTAAVALAAAGTVGWQLLDRQDFFYLLGHVSFAITFLAYAQKDLIKLRLVAIGSLVVGLVYNTYVHLHMPPGQNLWPVLSWMGIFLIQNLFKAWTEVRSTMEVPLPLSQKSLMANSFPQMHTRDWKLFLSQATVRKFKKGDVLLERGGATDSLMLIAEGKATEERDWVNGSTMAYTCDPGTVWGELTYVIGEDAFNASPVRIVVATDTLTIYAWPYEKLRELARSDRFAAALQHGFVYSAGVKHGLLWTGVPRPGAVSPLAMVA